VKKYLVGGAIRNQLLGLPSQDQDYVLINCTEQEFMRQYPHAKRVGRKNPCYIVNGKEYTLSKAEGILQDLASRDLSINALARDDQGKLYSHENSLLDLENKVLRPVKEENFFSDPLRVFRAARLAAYLPEFKVHPELRQAMQKLSLSGKLEGLAAERVGQEVLKTLATAKPGRFFKLLHETNCLYPWLQELIDFEKITAGPFSYHNQSLLRHLIKTLNKLAYKPLLAWMALCLNLGKPLTNPEIKTDHHRYESIGQESANTLGQRLRMPKKFIQAGVTASKLHIKAGLYSNLKTGTKVDLLMQLQAKNLFEEMFLLTQADKGKDYLAKAKQDLNLILKVKLPRDKKDLGPNSGTILRKLRIQSLQV
jgi:tRNA nucleotidyltransferase (CCA-adding enzyme)